MVLVTLILADKLLFTNKGDPAHFRRQQLLSIMLDLEDRLFRINLLL